MKYNKFTLLLALVIGCNWGFSQSYSDETGSEIPAAVTSSYYKNAKNVDIQQSAKSEAPWESVGPWGGNMRELETDPFNADHVLAGAGFSMAAEVGGLYYSNDGGITWEASDLLKMPIYAIESSSVEGEFYAGGKNGLYKSVDGGQTWTLFDLANIFVLEIGLKENNDDVILVGQSSNKGIIRTVDGGENWEFTTMEKGYMQGYGSSPANPEAMFVVMSGFADTCLMVTTDDGANFTEIGPGGGAAWDVWIADDDADHILLAHDMGVYETFDGGDNWDLIYASADAVKGIDYHNGNLYAAIYGHGIAESTDDGATWTLNESTVQKHFASATSSSAGFLACYWGGIYRGSGIGDTYVLSHEGINNAYVHSVAYYADRNELWAATEGSGLYVSYDGGLSWEAKNKGLGSLWVLTIAPLDHKGFSIDRMMVATQMGVYYSDDNGENWAPLALEGEQTLGTAIHWDDPETMWVAGSMGPVLHTTDGGQNWTEATGLPFALSPRLALAKNESDETRVLISYEMIAQEPYYSDDMGATFVPAEGAANANNPMITVRPESENYAQQVYLATSSGLYLSDYGANYTKVETLSGFLWSVYGEADEIYVGGNNGIYRSPDNGVTWEGFNENIDDLGIWSIVTGDAGDVYAGSRGRGVFRNNIFTGTEDINYEHHIQAAVYPNPLSNNTIISLNLRQKSNVEVSVYNYTGQKVTDLYNGTLSKGANQLNWETGQLESGVYFCILKINDQQQTLKLLKNK